MASASNPALHMRLYLQLIALSWTVVLCFVGFQYTREKQYKSEFLNAQLQQYNRRLLAVVEDGMPYEEFIDENDKPFDDLRITLITLSGAVIYDNTLHSTTLDNHSTRPEIVEALKRGSGYKVGRRSASDGRAYFYSATAGDRVVVRSAIPYSSTLQELLEADRSFIELVIAVTFIMSVVAFFTTRKLGKKIERINRYEAEQERAKLKRQLTNNINHELKTPVASMQVCLETLLSGISLTDEKRQELIVRCYSNAERLRNMLDEVSLLTRMEDGGMLICKERVVINDILAEIADEVRPKCEEEGMELHIDFAQEVAIEGNTSLVGSIFRNLVENAIAYSGCSNIHIRLTNLSDTECGIRFEDDGRGVDEEALPRLFERFYRVDKGRSRQKGGTGLGLAIVKHAVQFHGGTIGVGNRQGGGLCFDFTLKRQAHNATRD